MYTKVSPMQTSLKYGLILSALMIVISIVAYITGLMVNPISLMLIGFLSIIVMIVINVLAIKSHRDDLQNGYISLGQSVAIGALVGLVYAVIGGLFNILLYEVIDPDLMSSINENMADWIVDMTGDDSMYDQMEAQSQSSIQSFFINLLGLPCCGAVLSIILGLILKNEPEDNSQL